jgi:hypothetical protein
MRLPAYTLETVNGREIPVGRWPNLEAFALDATLRSTRSNAADGSNDSSLDRDRGVSHDLGHNFDGVVQRALGGWAEQAQAIRDIAMPIVTKVTSHIELEHYDFTDDGSIASDFDVATALTGDPSCWLQHRTEIVEGKGQRIIRIGCMVNGNSSLDAHRMLRRGSIGAALAYCLEAAGFSVHVIGYTCNADSMGGDQPLTMQCVTLKNAGEMMDLNRIAVGLAHPGTHRRLGWACRELEDRVPRMCRASDYSRSIELPEAVRQSEKLDIYVPTSTAYMSDEQMVGWIVDELVKQGVKLSSTGK